MKTSTIALIAGGSILAFILARKYGYLEFSPEIPKTTTPSPTNTGIVPPVTPKPLPVPGVNKITINEGVKMPVTTIAPTPVRDVVVQPKPLVITKQIHMAGLNIR